MTQEFALATLKSGLNVFLTGSAGTGKTYVLNQYISYLKDRKVPVAITASTGIAATHMNGQTIHSWCGMGIKDELSKKELSMMKLRKHLKKNIDKARVLIIDEISMLHRKQLDLVNEILKYFKEDRDAFGGMQIILSGDFFQLPPVGSKGEISKEKFAFMSKAWLDAELKICYLTEQYRQQDSQMTTILNEIRRQEVSDDSIQALVDTQNQIFPENIQPTKLYTHNADVDTVNKSKLEQLEGISKTYEADFYGNPLLLESLKKSVLAEELLELKLGAQVMFVRNNYDKGYMNGTLGEVIEFTRDALPLVRLLDGRTVIADRETWSINNEMDEPLASYTQVPLRLAWAITVHKSQGMTLDAATMDLSRTFESGQGYVALSRLKSIEGLKLEGLNPKALSVDDFVRRVDLRMQELANQFESATDISILEKQAIPFIKLSGGITDPSEIEKNRKRGNIKEPKEATHVLTKALIEEGFGLAEIAEERGLKKNTIVSHLVKIKAEEPKFDLSKFQPSKKILDSVGKVLKKFENDPEKLKSLGALKKACDPPVSYDDLKLALIFLR